MELTGFSRIFVVLPTAAKSLGLRTRLQRGRVVDGHTDDLDRYQVYTSDDDRPFWVSLILYGVGTPCRVVLTKVLLPPQR